MPIRYMGTKRHVAHRVRRLAEEVCPDGKVVDLFSGMGCVAEGLAGFRSVVTNDALGFTAVLARARFMGTQRSMTAAEAVHRLRDPYRKQFDYLLRLHRDRIKEEDRALDGDRAALVDYMGSARHVGNDPGVARQASMAAVVEGPAHYCMATLYFSAGYFGLRQALQVDALRYAIDSLDQVAADIDWLLGAWLASAATVLNAPGHTAQYLKPNTEAATARIRRYWRRNVWAEFQNRLVDLKPVGSPDWRHSNRSEIADAVLLLASGRLADVGLVYADPPYTKDQYSRYYHVYETLVRYDFPGSLGEGRTRPEAQRFSTGFSLKSQVVDTFARMFDAVNRLDVPLILSYPSQGLLADAHATVAEVAAGRLRITKTQSFPAEHSTLGASQGSKTKLATENLYVCYPA